jgi:hypothetical protein
VANTPAYYDTAKITNAKCFIVQAPEVGLSIKMGPIDIPKEKFVSLPMSVYLELVKIDQKLSILEKNSYTL